MATRFTEKERLHLVLILRVLELLEDNETNKYNYHYDREILEQGYMDKYDKIIKFDLKDEFSNGEFVRDVLNMYLDIIDSFNILEDKQDIEKIIFPGFCGGKSESRYLEYAEFLINNDSAYERLKKPKGKDFDCTCNMITSYDKMLIKYNEIEMDSRRNMTVDMIKEILQLQFNK